MCISTRLESEIDRGLPGLFLDRASALRVKLRKRSKPYSQRLLCLYHLRQFVIPEARRFLLSADSPFVIRRRALLESHPILHYRLGMHFLQNLKGAPQTISHKWESSISLVLSVLAFFKSKVRTYTIRGPA